MKKLINLFYLVTLLFTNNVTENVTDKSILTKPLICIEGTNYENYLFYEGYEIIENNVNFNMPGKYHVTYQSKDDQKFVKNVDVISKDNLNNLSYYQITKQNYDNNNDYYDEGLMTKLIDNEYSYYVISYFDRDNEASTEYLDIYYNNTLIKQTTISTDQELKITKILKTNTNLYLVGTKKHNNSSYDIYVSEYSLIGEFVRDFYIHGNNYDEVKDAIIVDDYMYITGVSSSNDGYFHGGIDNDVFLFKVDFKLGIIRKSYNSNTIGSETVTNLVYFEDALYYGYSYLKNGYKNCVVRKINLNLETIQELDYGYRIGIDISKLATDDYNLYILMSYHDYDLKRNISVLNVVSSNLTYVNQFIYKFIDYSFVKPIDLVINKDNIISLLFQVNTVNYIPGYSLIKLKDNKEILNVIKCENNYPVKFKDNNGNTIYTKVKNKLIEEKVNSVLVFDFGPDIIDNESSVNDYLIYINSKKVVHDNKLSKISYDLDNFGSYNLLYYFKTQDVDFIYTKNYYIKENTNIVNNETYDKDFRLYFNGTAYLNGELIDNGFKVTEVGKYTLDLIGKDGIQKKYSFFIEDNSLKNKDITDNKTVSIKENNINTQETDINIGVNQIPYEQKEDFINKDYLMLIPVIIFTATLLCLFKIK